MEKRRRVQGVPKSDGQREHYTPIPPTEGTSILFNPSSEPSWNGIKTGFKRKIIRLLP